MIILGSQMLRVMSRQTVRTITTKINANPRLQKTINTNHVRTLGYTQVETNTHFLHMTELQRCGKTTETSYTLGELTALLQEDRFNLRIPPRDLKIFFRTELQSKTGNSILVRPDSKCFLLELEQLKIICFPDKCLVLNSTNRVVKGFLDELKLSFPDTTATTIRQDSLVDGKVASSLKNSDHSKLCFADERASKHSISMDSYT